MVPTPLHSGLLDDLLARLRGGTERCVGAGWGGGEDVGGRGWGRKCEGGSVRDGPCGGGVGSKCDGD